MKLFKHEMKTLRRPLMFWLLGLLFLVGAGLAKYEGLREGGAEVSAMLGSFPRIVQAMFGMVGLDALKLSGYFGILMFYFLICTALYGGLMGSDAIAGETIDHTTEFIYTKPISRSQILLVKLLARVICLLVFCIANLLLSVGLLWQMKLGSGIEAEILCFTVDGFLLGLLFMAVGLCIASLLKDVRKAASFTMGIFGSTFLLMILYDILEAQAARNVLRLFTPLRYFLPEELVAGKLSIDFVGLILLLIIGLTAFAVIRFEKRDLAV